MRTLVFGLALAGSAISCKTASVARVPSAPPKPSSLLGSAFDASIGEYTGMSCVDTSALASNDYEYVPAKWNEVRSALDIERPILEKVFGNFQSSFYSEATGLRLSRPREAMNRILSTAEEATQLVYLSSRSGVFRIKAESVKKLRLNAEAQALVRDSEAFAQLCGTDFLVGTAYTVGISASLRLIFPSAADRAAYQGSVRDLDEKTAIPGVTLRYESFLKETWDLNFRILGDVMSRDCPSGGYEPCLDAFRIFQNSTLPKYQKLMVSRLRNPDTVLPLAYLADAERLSYRVLEPDLRQASLALADQAALQNLRDRFVEAYAKAARLVKNPERAQEISGLASPCYRPVLDPGQCRNNFNQLPANLRP